MSQDPTQNPYGGPPPQDPNQNPYGGSPPQNPYGTPPQNPYGELPPNYGTPPGYGVPPPGYGTAPGYGYNAPPPTEPLPLGEALRQLPSQYIRVLTKPSPTTFAIEMGRASWDIVWVQLLISAVLSAILSYAGSLINPFRFTSLGTTSPSPVNPGTFQGITLGASLGSVILVPLFFFIGAGILYLLAKAFGGTGTFLAQSYTFLLIGVPVGIVSGLLSLIPILGGLVAFGLSIYAIVLEVFAIMAVHRLSGGKATAVVLIPVGVAILLAICLVVVVIAIVAASLPR